MAATTAVTGEADVVVVSWRTSESRLKWWSLFMSSKDFVGAMAWIGAAGRAGIAGPGSIAEDDDVEVGWLVDGSGVAGD